MMKHAPSYAPGLPGGFLARLKSLDPALTVRWGEGGFWVICRMVRKMQSCGKVNGVIHLAAVDVEIPVLCVTDERGRYREPGDHDIFELQKADSWQRNETGRQMAERFQQANRDAEERQDEQARQDISDMVDEGADTLLCGRHTRPVAGGGTF